MAVPGRAEPPEVPSWINRWLAQTYIVYDRRNPTCREQFETGQSVVIPKLEEVGIIGVGSFSGDAGAFTQKMNAAQGQPACAQIVNLSGGSAEESMTTAEAISGMLEGLSVVAVSLKKKRGGGTLKGSGNRVLGRLSRGFSYLSFVGGGLAVIGGVVCLVQATK